MAFALAKMKNVLPVSKKGQLVLALFFASIGSLFFAVAPANAAVWTDQTTITHSGEEFSKTTDTQYSVNPCHYIRFDDTPNPSTSTPATLVNGKTDRSSLDGCSDDEGSPITVKPLGSPDGAGNGNDEAGAGDREDRVCSAGALGWMICPFIEATRNVTLEISGWLAAILNVNPLSFDNNDPVFKAWGNILVFANLALVIAFLMIIFSQATSYGLSSYGIKSMLPRVVAAAILMNLSYFIAAIMIDISNIAGAGISGLLLTTADGVNDAGSPTQLHNFMQDLYEPFAAGAVWMAAGIGVVIAVLALGLVPALIVVLVIFLLLAARIAFIILLVMIAPLAFAAWILPNTEKYFKKWWDLFLQMLVLYPVLMALFSGSVVASTVVANAGNDSAGGDISNQVIALLIMMVPLFALPFVLRASSSTLDKVGRMAHRYGMRAADSKAGSFVRERSKNYAKFGALSAANRFDQRSRKRWTEKYGKDENGNDKVPYRPGRMKRMGAQARSAYMDARAYDQTVSDSLEARKHRRDRDISERAAKMGSREGGAAAGIGGDVYRARAAAAIDKAFEESVSAAAAFQKNKRFSDIQDIAYSDVTKSGASEAERVAAARQVMDKGNFNERLQMYAALDTADTSARLRQTVSDQFYAKGDHVVLTPGYGDALFTGQAGGASAAEFAKRSAAKRIREEKVDAKTMVHDAEATQLMLEVASEDIASGGTKYGLGTEAVESLRRSAQVALVNEETKQKATAGIYKKKIETIANLGGGPPPSPGGGGSTPPPPSSPGGSPGPSGGGGGGGSTPSGGGTPYPASPQYTAPYSPADLQSLGIGGINMIVGNAGGTTKLSTGDLEKITEATRGSTEEGMRNIYKEMQTEQDRRMKQMRDAQSEVRNPGGGPVLSSPDSSGRETPDTATDDYHDGMTK